MATFVRNGQAQVEVAAAFALQELRGMVDKVRDGAVPIPAAKPNAEPVTFVEKPPTQTSDPVLAAAAFRVIDRSSESRAFKVAGPQF
jgi:hypothetical protein